MNNKKSSRYLSPFLAVYQQLFDYFTLLLKQLYAIIAYTAPSAYRSLYRVIQATHMSCFKNSCLELEATSGMFLVCVHVWIYVRMNEILTDNGEK